MLGSCPRRLDGHPSVELRTLRALIKSRKRRLLWLASHAKRENHCVAVATSTDDVKQRMINATVQSRRDEIAKERRKKAFVEGGFPGNGMSFIFTGYRERQWIQPLLDPDRILKPRLKGSLEISGTTSLVIYRVDVRIESGLFFVLGFFAILLALLGVVLASLYGVPVPGPAFFSLLLAGVCIAAANGFWETVPNAEEDEAFLKRWLEETLDDALE
jgi:hypothetical protein